MNSEENSFSRNRNLVNLNSESNTKPNPTESVSLINWSLCVCHYSNKQCDPTNRNRKNIWHRNQNKSKRKLKGSWSYRKKRNKKECECGEESVHLIQLTQTNDSKLTVCAVSFAADFRFLLNKQKQNKRLMNRKIITYYR